jgi:hypothetical protein
VSLLAPVHLSALVSSQTPAAETRLYCRKRRGQPTEYFAEKPADWGGWVPE